MDLLPQNAWLEALGWAIVNSWWQFGILWIVWLLVQKLWPLPSAASKYNLAMALLLLGSAWVVSTGFTFEASDQLYSGLAQDNSALLGISWWEQLQRGFYQLFSFISLFYLVWLAYRFTQLAFQYQDLRRDARMGLHKSPATLRIFVDTMSSRMTLGKKVEIWLSDKIDSPQIMGWIKPIVLLPVSAINQLSPAQIEAILIHELAHIKRNDYIFNWIVSILENLFFFNPFVKLFISVIREEREHACDDWVLQFPFTPSEYAEALLLLEQKRNSKSLSLVLAAGGSHRTLLLNRVKRMLQLPFKNQQKQLSAGLLFLILASTFIGPFFPSTGRTDTGTVAKKQAEAKILNGWNAGISSWNQLFPAEPTYLTIFEKQSAERPESVQVQVLKNTDKSISETDNQLIETVIQIDDKLPPNELTWVSQETDAAPVMHSAAAEVIEEMKAFSFERSQATLSIPEEAASFYMLPYVPKKSFEIVAAIDTLPALEARLLAERKEMEAALQTQLALNKINWVNLQQQLLELGHQSGSEKEIKSLLENELAKINWTAVQQEAERVLQNQIRQEMLQKQANQQQLAASYQQALQQLEQLDQELKKLEESLQKALEIKEKQLRKKEAELRKKHKIVHI
ncbi:M48 family metalloprotease [Flavihumibacter sp. RY-1]|uniref:M48 family metalloprotease n=1 Tax=Flavihumibacter fluminis TaxID=2909236 RepID=A0ABS9BJ34_9BACT|nr:M56 family metallopeptidase [Flavihumibacter fluminis]MCF1714834.1 M48 family metalloprotease [Flavihumibacter fluminis]